jgi:hypothetical protein
VTMNYINRVFKIGLEFGCRSGNRGRVDKVQG